MNAEPADRPLLERQVEIGRRRLQRVERLAVVLDPDRQHGVVERQRHVELMLGGVVVAVRDDVRHELVQHEMDGHHDLGGQLLFLAEPLGELDDPLELGFAG